MSQERGVEAYAARLTDCLTLDDLKALMVLYGDDLAVDARRVVATMTDADLKEFRRGLKSERKGRFAGDDWAKRFITILMPEPMFTIARIAEEYKVPFDVAWRRLKEVRPDYLASVSEGPR